MDQIWSHQSVQVQTSQRNGKQTLAVPMAVVGAHGVLRTCARVARSATGNAAGCIGTTLSGFRCICGAQRSLAPLLLRAQQADTRGVFVRAMRARCSARRGDALDCNACAHLRCWVLHGSCRQHTNGAKPSAPRTLRPTRRAWHNKSRSRTSSSRSIIIW